MRYLKKICAAQANKNLQPPEATCDITAGKTTAYIQIEQPDGTKVTISTIALGKMILDNLLNNTKPKLPYTQEELPSPTSKAICQPTKVRLSETVKKHQTDTDTTQSNIAKGLLKADKGQAEEFIQHTANNLTAEAIAQHMAALNELTTTVLYARQLAIAALAAEILFHTASHLSPPSRNRRLTGQLVI